MSYQNYCLIEYIPDILVYGGEEHIIQVSVSNEQGLPKDVNELDWDFIMCKYGENSTSDSTNIVADDIGYSSLTNTISIILRKENTVGKVGKYKFQIKYRLTLNPDKVGDCTIAIGDPTVVTCASHGLSANSKIFFTSTGSLPTGMLAVNANTSGGANARNYYVLPADLTASTFKFSDSIEGDPVVTSGTQSGTHSLYNALSSYNRIFVAAQGVINFIPTNITSSIT